MNKRRINGFIVNQKAKTRFVRFTLAFAISIFVMPVTLVGQEHHNDDGDHDGVMAGGSHGGRLLQEGEIQIELAIFERGSPPEFRAWITAHGESLHDDDIELEIELTRLGGQIDRISFTKSVEYWRGDHEVFEPHSFDVKVVATIKGKPYQWQYESYEGRVTILPEIAEQAGIVSSVAGEQTLHDTVHLFGKTVIDPQQISHIRARYPGMIKQVNVSLGDQVKAGDVLLHVEANNSLQNYTVTSPIDGTVIQRHANAGEVSGESPLLTIADYHRLWVELNVFPSHANIIKPGQIVRIDAGTRSAETEIRYLTPTDMGGPSILARALLANDDSQWTPELMVDATVSVAQYLVPIAVDNRALQSFRDWTVVFIQVGDTYEIRPLDIGRNDGEFTEVLDGLKVGDRYVVENSYLIKADIEKSGAAHDH